MDMALRDLPPQPETWRYDIPSYMEEMRNAVLHLAMGSFDPALLGEWTALESDRFLSLQRADGEAFEALGVDGNAFYMQNPQRTPFLRHTLSDFIRAAAKIVNDLVRYPLPAFGSPGFAVDCKLYAKDFLSGGIQYGNASEGVLDVSNENGSFQITRDYLAYWRCNQPESHKEIGSGKAYDHIWHYTGGGLFDPPHRIKPYKMPELQGTAPMRFHVRAVYGENYTGLEELIDRDDEQIIDFSAGCAAGGIDFSAAAAKIDEVMNTDGDDTAAWRRYVVQSISDCEIKLRGENFKPLPYKYLEK